MEFEKVVIDMGKIFNDNERNEGDLTTIALNPYYAKILIDLLQKCYITPTLDHGLFREVIIENLEKRLKEYENR